jgi:hypothetical protein
MRIFSLLASAFFLCLSFISLPVQAAPPFVAAGLHWPGGKAQFFMSDGSYVRYDVKADRADPGYPQPITNKNWPGLGPYARQIIAATNGRDPGKAYFFLANGTYLRYDVAQDRVDPGYPQPVDNRTWPGLGRYATKLYGALNWSSNKIQFFLNDGTYLRYDTRRDSVDDGYPKPINRSTWPGIAPYADHLAGGINWLDGKAYIFLDDGRYLRYDISGDRVDAGYPKPIDNRTWPGLYGFFRRR